MQQTGTLKKRRRRNLAKVNGLGTVPYDENADLFTGRELFGNGIGKGGNDSLKPFATRNGQDIRLQFSAKGMLDYRREAGGMPSSRTRVTRDPNYHDDDDDGDGFDDDLEGGREDFVGLGPLNRRPNLPDSIKSRSHFLDKYSMQRLRQLLLLGQTSGAFPWKWNKEETCIDKWSPKLERLWKLQWFVVTIQTGFLSLFQLYAFFHSFSEVTSGKKTYREVFMSSFSLLWYTWAVYFNVNMYLYKDQMRQYINTMFKFNQKYVERYLLDLTDYQDGGRLVINLAILSNISQVFVSVSLFLRMPYQPWYLFSFIYPKPWYWLVPGAIQEFIVVGQVITSYMFISWIVVVHCNTVQFWLREIHNHNDSDYTVDEIRSPGTSFETYKALQILNQIFNDAMAPLAIPLVKIHMSSAMVPCGYVLIRSMNHIFVDEFPGILTYPIGVLDCATAGFVIMSMAAEVFDLGCSFIDSWSRTKHKDFRRILMSCPTMKIWVGRYYFLTVSTTITFFKVIFDYITDCIITFQ